MKKILGGFSILTVLALLAGCTFSGWVTYTNTAYGFQLQYPPGGSIVAGATDTAVRIQLPITPGTNLAEKYLDIDVQDGAATCESPLAAGYAPGIITPVSMTINGLPWVKEHASEGAAGSLFDWTAYSTVSGSVCVVLTFVLHSHNPEIFPTPPPTFNSSAESGVFILIVNTFKWLGAGNAAVTPTLLMCATASLHAPSLLTPADGAVISNLDPTLTWHYPDACVPEGYRVDLSVDPTFADTSLSGGTGNPSTSWGPAHPLADCTTYFWKVAPINGTTLGPASEVFTFRTNASGTCAPEATATVQGMLWYDQCSVALDVSPVPSPLPGGCVVDSYGVDADGIHQPGEPFMAGITVNMGPGDCPVGGPLSGVTDASGRYSISGLAPGKYCINVNAASFAGPGATGHWTVIPSGHEGNTYRSVLLGAGEVLTGQDFAWYQNVAGPTPVPSITPFHTPSPSPLIFTPRASPMEFNYQVLSNVRVCLLKNPQVDISVTVSNPSLVHGVVLFFRLKNKANAAETPWNAGVNMNPKGNGIYDKSLSANQIPNLSAISAGGASAWLEYQFAAIDMQGNTIGRSQVYADVSLSPCK